MVGLGIIFFFAVVACAGAAAADPDPVATSWSAIRKAPSRAHWLGTDDIGRDILSRMIWGARASLLAGVFSVVDRGRRSACPSAWSPAISAAGSTRSSRAITEAFLAMPFLITAIALAAFLGPSLTNAMIAIGLSAMPIFVRLTRGQVLAVKTEEYVEGARSIGLRHFSIITRYILPNVFAPILVQATLTIATAIIAEASLSFLGLGQQPPAPSWGSMLNVAKNFLEPGALDGHVAGARDLSRRDRLQSSRRRSARCARPARSVKSSKRNSK